MSYIKIDDDTVVTENGVELRRGPNPYWAEYETWLSEGNTPAERFTSEKWEALNDNSRLRLKEVRPLQ